MWGGVMDSVRKPFFLIIYYRDDYFALLKEDKELTGFIHSSIIYSTQGIKGCEEAGVSPSGFLVRGGVQDTPWARSPV